MTAGLESVAAEEWLESTLAGDATLTGLVEGGVWNTQAAQGTAYPLIVFQQMAGYDYAAVGANRIWTNLVYMVKVINETADFSTLSAAVARIDALLHRSSGIATDGTIWSCVREQTIRLPDAIAGRQYRQAGGLYRIYAS